MRMALSTGDARAGCVSNSHMVAAPRAGMHGGMRLGLRPHPVQCCCFGNSEPKGDQLLARPQRAVSQQEPSLQQRQQQPSKAACLLLHQQEPQQQQQQQRQRQQHLGMQRARPASPAALQQDGDSSRRRSSFQLASQQHSGNSCGSDKSSNGPKPEPPSTSGAPPPDRAGSSSSSSSSSSSDQKQQQKQQPSSPTTTSSMSDVDVEAAVDKMLDRTWQELKRDLKRELSPEQAAIIDSWNVSDIQTDKVFRDIAEQQLGPILEVMGIREDPYEFFLDMFKLALALQLGSAGLVFYGAELLLGLDAGDGFRAVAGLALGYFLRLGIKIEHLAWPLYNAFVQLLIREDAVYEYPAATPDERQDTLNKLGLAIACSFLVPKFLFGWQNDDCWQIVLPMVGGLFLFDLCYLVALLIKLWGHDDRQE